MRERKFLAMLIAICMIAGCLCTPVFADTVAVTTEAELIAAITAGGSITLGDDIELTNRLRIEADKTVELDLAGHTLSITATTTEEQEDWEDIDGDGDYEELIDVTVGINAINNLGDLTIKGGGTVTSRRNAIYNAGTLTVENGTFAGSSNAIYNEGSVTINSGSFSGTEYSGVYSYDGTVTIIGGTFTSEYDYSVWINDGELTIYDGIFSGYGVYNYGTAKIKGGSYTSVGRYAITNNGDITIDYSNCDVKSFSGVTLTDGEYTGITAISATVPADSTARVQLNNAYLAGSINGGYFSGTVSNAVLTYITGGTFTKELKESIEELGLNFSKGYGFVENEDETFSVQNIGTVTFALRSNDTAMGTLSGVKYSVADSSGSGFSEITDKTATKGTVATFSATATANENYAFKGWYTDPAGNGELLSAEATLTDYKYVMNENTVIYAVFVESGEYQAFIEAANSWLGDYTASEYTVSSKDEMEYFAYAVNTLGKDFTDKTVTLTKDLTYESTEKYTPVGDTNYAFNGTFDGGSNTISGITLTSGYKYVGIFGRTGGKALVKDLKVSNCTFNCTFNGSYTGGLIGELRGTVTNCTASDITVDGYFAGGLIGHTFAASLNNISVSNIIATGYFKQGGVIGYADDLTVDGAVVTGVSQAEGANGVFGAFAGHINAGTTVLNNIRVDAVGEYLVATNYSSTNGTITIKGENTQITAGSIVSANASSKTIVIENGSYSVGTIVENDTDKTSNVVITGGSFSQDFSDYCKEGYGMQKESDGTWNLTRVTVWYTDTDSGFYTVDDVNFGMMRFLFRVVPVGTITKTGIKYIKGSDISSDVAGSSETGTDSVFYGDIIRIPYGTAGTYYAAAYVTTSDGNTEWSDVISCTPNFLQQFTEYTEPAEGGNK